MLLPSPSPVKLIECSLMGIGERSLRRNLSSLSRARTDSESPVPRILTFMYLITFPGDPCISAKVTSPLEAVAALSGKTYNETPFLISATKTKKEFHYMFCQIEQ